MEQRFIGLVGAVAVLCASIAMAQTARDIRGPAPVVPLANEPPPKNRRWRHRGEIYGIAGAWPRLR